MSGSDWDTPIVPRKQGASVGASSEWDTPIVARSLPAVATTPTTPTAPSYSPLDYAEGYGSLALKSLASGFGTAGDLSNLASKYIAEPIDKLTGDYNPKSNYQDTPLPTTESLTGKGSFLARHGLVNNPSLPKDSDLPGHSIVAGIGNVLGDPLSVLGLGELAEGTGAVKSALGFGSDVGSAAAAPTLAQAGKGVGMQAAAAGSGAAAADEVRQHVNPNSTLGAILPVAASVLPGIGLAGAGGIVQSAQDKAAAQQALQAGQDAVAAAKQAKNGVGEQITAAKQAIDEQTQGSIKESLENLANTHAMADKLVGNLAASKAPNTGSLTPQGIGSNVANASQEYLEKTLPATKESLFSPIESSVEPNFPAPLNNVQSVVGN